MHSLSRRLLGVVAPKPEAVTRRFRVLAKRGLAFPVCSPFSRRTRDPLAWNPKGELSGPLAGQLYVTSMMVTRDHAFAVAAFARRSRSET
jgi:hypothetical protein